MTSECRVFFRKLLTLLTGQSAGALRSTGVQSTSNYEYNVDANVYKPNCYYWQIQQLAKMYGMNMGEILQCQHFMLMHVIMSDLLCYLSALPILWPFLN